MLNYIWAFIIVIPLLYMLITGDASIVLQSITNGAENAVTLGISLVGIYCFWLGIMNIARESGLTEKLSRALAKPLRKIFPDAGTSAFGNISMNVAANMLGLGNAATPFGLTAMQQLKSESPLSDTASNGMIRFIILNTASVQLIPTTVISLRASMGAYEPASIVITTLITTFSTALFGLLLCKLFERRQK